MKNTIKYRPEIDGLRAIAVLAVITYHLNSKWIPGGYLGVDIFFVISGYLITSMIFDKLSDGSFSFKEFWLRRIKRLLPALICMVAVVMMVGPIILIQPERGDLSAQAIATIFSFNNILLWKTTGGYWSSASENIPLLHTWSLSVEEQFYLCLPIVLYLLLKFQREKIPIYFTSFFLISISLYVYGNKFHSNATFYLFPTRMWELLIGSFLAIFPWYKQYFKKVVITNWLAIIGFLFLIFSFYKIINIPLSSYNLLTCIGAFLIIQNTQTAGVIKKILSFNYIVKIGKISYSLYLWHWPVIVFSKYINTEISYISSIMLIFCLSILSYLFVEKPIRYGTVKPKIALAPVPVIILACIVINTLYPTSPLIASLGNIDAKESFTLEWEFEATDEIMHGKSGVIFNNDALKNKRPIVVFGSSHAMMICKPIKEMSEYLNQPFISMSTSGIGLMSDKPTQNNPNAKVINELRFKELANLKPSVLIVGEMWSSEVEIENFQVKFEDMLRYFLRHSDRVIVIGQVPLIELPLGYKNALRKYLVAKNNSNDIDGLSSSVKVKKANEIIEEVVNSINNEKIEFVNPYSLFIKPNNQVMYMLNGKFLYSDYHHINNLGASLIVNNMIGPKIFSLY